MLNSEKKIRALRDKNNKYSNSCIVREKKSERNKKPYPPPPFKLNGRSLTIKDKTKISLTIKMLHLGQGSFTRKVRAIFTLKIIVSIFVKLFLILVLHLRQFFIVRIFVKRATVFNTRVCLIGYL